MNNRFTAILSVILISFMAIILPINPVLSKDKSISTSWNFYRNVFINKDGRVIDYQRDYLTTSEGQGYALLRAVLMDDRDTFDKVYKWTKNNLKREDDNLFAWSWGKKTDNTYGKIDENTASDADIDIATSLIQASKIWQEPQYLVDARKIITDIWNKETIQIKDMRILASGVKQAGDEIPEINPSYFAPYAFRMFAVYDKNNDWNQLVDSSYSLINSICGKTQSHLPPDWFVINRETGEVSLSDDTDKSDFSYDAVRVFFRVYVDYRMNQEPRAERFLSGINFFIDKWNKDRKFYTNYREDGRLRDKIEETGSIILLLPVVEMFDTQAFNEIYKSRIKPEYNKAGYWSDPFNYYAQNLAWFSSWVLEYNANQKKSK